MNDNYELSILRNRINELLNYIDIQYKTVSNINDDLKRKDVFNAKFAPTITNALSMITDNSSRLNGSFINLKNRLNMVLSIINQIDDDNL